MPTTPNRYHSYKVETALGNTKHSNVADVVIDRIGRNPEVGIVEESVWAAGGLFNFITSPQTMRVRAGGNVNDTDGGSGAHEIVLLGIDENGEVATEALTLAGASASAASTTVFWRIFRTTVTRVGVYGGANTGDIIVEDTGGDDIMSTITAGTAMSQLAFAATGLGRSLLLTSISVYVEGIKEVNIKVNIREDYTKVGLLSAPVQQLFSVDAVIGNFTQNFEQPIKIPPSFGEIWVNASTNVSTSAVTVILSLIAVTDT